MPRMIRQFIVAFGLLAPALPAGADNSLLFPMLASIQVDEKDGASLASMVDEQHSDLSETVVNLGQRVDRFFGGEHYDREQKTSELRLSMRTLFSEDGVEFDPKIRFRLALPNTEQRLSVVLESARNDLFGDSRSEVPPGVARDGDDDVFAGLRYIQRFAEVWNVDADAGVKVKVPPDPYVRVRGGRSWGGELGEARLSQSIFWENSDGAGATTELLLQRDLEGPKFLQAVTEATWLDRYQRFFYGQTVILTHTFSEDHAVQFRVGVHGESEPASRLTRYYVNLPWRRNIYRNWLFLEIRPELLFDEENDFDAQPRLFLELEGYFGDEHVAPGYERLREEAPLQQPLPGHVTAFR